jgi:hypothetical protein
MLLRRSARIATDRLISIERSIVVCSSIPSYPLKKRIVPLLIKYSLPDSSLHMHLHYCLHVHLYVLVLMQVTYITKRKWSSFVGIHRKEYLEFWHMTWTIKTSYELSKWLDTTKITTSDAFSFMGFYLNQNWNGVVFIWDTLLYYVGEIRWERNTYVSS